MKNFVLEASLSPIELHKGELHCDSPSMRRLSITILGIACALVLACGGKNSATKPLARAVPIPSNLLAYGEIPNAMDGTILTTWGDTIMPGQGAQLSASYSPAIQGFMGSMVSPADSIDFAAPVRVFAVKAEGKDEPELVLMASKKAELAATEGNTLAPLGGNVFLVGPTPSLQSITAFAGSLDGAVSNHRGMVFPPNLINNYQAEFDKFKAELKKETATATPEMQQLAPFLNSYIEGMESMARQIDSVTMTLDQTLPKMLIDARAISQTTVAAFFGAQKPAAFDLKSTLPESYPIYSEGYWLMGEARTTILNAMYEMMEAMDPNLPWRERIAVFMEAFTGSYVAGITMNPMARPPEIDGTVAYGINDGAKAISALKGYMDMLKSFKPFGQEMPAVTGGLQELKSKNGTDVYKMDINTAAMGQDAVPMSGHIFLKEPLMFYVMGKGGLPLVETILTGKAATPQPRLDTRISQAKASNANSILWMDLGPLSSGMAPIDVTMLTIMDPSNMRLSIELERQ